MTEVEVEIRNMRTEGRIAVAPDGTELVYFKAPHAHHAMTIVADEWRRMGEPTYVVANLRCETFGESTP